MSDVVEDLENLSIDDLKEKAEQLYTKLDELNYYSKILILSADESVLKSNFDVVDEEIPNLLTRLEDYDTTIGEGVTFGGFHHDAHRFYKDQGLVYGRRGDSETGEGFCVCKVGPVFTITTFTFPHITAKVVPALRNSCTEVYGS
eukprot:TRINITY_DN110_c0_g3_i1.p1 TRINITY_DN110_c0_g3~~TRINITY_DN110_c0_g3_i1.p1  ORF type:complete len:145 (-),score=45.60 TRINITY_DN110_c0_g3_i1:22-456(-)